MQLPWRDPQFLLPALSLLEAQRTVHLDIAAGYARQRREQKAAGFRFPARCDVTPSDPRRWHGDERLGALHALSFWRRSGTDRAVGEHPEGRIVFAAVDSVLGMRPEPAALTLDRDELQPILDWARRQIHLIGWDSDRYRIAWVVCYLLGQLHLVDQGASPVATAWNFRA